VSAQLIAANAPVSRPAVHVWRPTLSLTQEFASAMATRTKTETVLFAPTQMSSSTEPSVKHAAPTVTRAPLLQATALLANRISQSSMANAHAHLAGTIRTARAHVLKRLLSAVLGTTMTAKTTVCSVAQNARNARISLQSAQSAMATST
jgi:hypothetical protein